jgi:hypothetical protein
VAARGDAPYPAEIAGLIKNADVFNRKLAQLCGFCKLWQGTDMR